MHAGWQQLPAPVRRVITPMADLNAWPVHSTLWAWCWWGDAPRTSHFGGFAMSVPVRRHIRRWSPLTSVLMAAVLAVGLAGVSSMSLSSLSTTIPTNMFTVLDQQG